MNRKRITYTDLGNLIYDQNDDYPLFAARVAKRIVKEKTKGILFCGSAEGVCIAANKIKGSRAVNPHGIIQAKFARKHEDANILCLAGGRTLNPQPGLSLSQATKLITTFLETPFSGEARHLRRLKEITKLEK